MNLTDAITKHAEWKVKFRSAMSQRSPLDAATIGRDNCCELGKWLYGDGKRFATLAPYNQAVAKHAEFHRQAGRVATAINAGKYSEAEAMMANGTPYASASSEVGVALLGLKRAAGI